MAETLTPADRLRKLGATVARRAHLDAEAPYSYGPGDRDAIQREGAADAAACAAGADALDRLAQTCGNCRHANTEDAREGWCFCAAQAPGLLRSYPFVHRAMPLDERCKGWAAKEGA